MSLARAPFFPPTNNLIPISKTREKEMLCARYEHRTNTDGKQSHYCSTIDAFFLSLFFFKLTLKTLRGKENRWNRLNGRIIVQRLTRIFLLFFFFLNLIFISITWHWYQKKKKKKRVGNAWHSRYGILIFVIIRSNGANSVLWPIFPGGVVAKLLCYSYAKLTYAARQK